VRSFTNKLNYLRKIEMQKKIIVLALAAAFSASANAETPPVTIYGEVSLSVESIENGDSFAGKKGSTATRLASNITKLGFKNKQDLGDDVSVLWQIEQQIDIDNNAAAGARAIFGGRNSYIGLSDKTLGTVTLGRNDSPYKLATRKLDVFNDYLADTRTLMGGARGKSSDFSFQGRPADIISYTSPELGGVTVIAAHVFGAEQSTASTVDKGSLNSVAALYKNGGLTASLAYEEHNYGTFIPATTNPTVAAINSGTFAALNAAANGQKEVARQVGVGYKFDALFLSATYEITSDTLKAGAAKYNHEAFSMAAKYDINANNNVRFSFTEVSKINAAPGTGAQQISLAFDHNLAKSTSVYALYTTLINDRLANYFISDSGSNGGGSNFPATGDGSRFTGLALGIKHKF
jgi:predicted porin